MLLLSMLYGNTALVALVHPTLGKLLFFKGLCPLCRCYDVASTQGQGQDRAVSLACIGASRGRKGDPDNWSVLQHLYPTFYFFCKHVPLHEAVYYLCMFGMEQPEGCKRTSRVCPSWCIINEFAHDWVNNFCVCLVPPVSSSQHNLTHTLTYSSIQDCQVATAAARQLWEVPQGKGTFAGWAMGPPTPVLAF